MGRQTSRRLRPQTFLENISPKIHQIQSGSEIFDTLAPTLREKRIQRKIQIKAATTILSFRDRSARTFDCKKSIMMLRSQALLRTGLSRRACFSTAAKVSDAKATVTTTPPPSKKKKRLVVAVGGNALQRRGDRLTIENMLVCSLIAIESDFKLMSGNGEYIARMNRFDSNKNQTFLCSNSKSIHAFPRRSMECFLTYAL